MYSMDMRNYDPAIGRWTSVDPIIHYSKSTYNAFDNNPVFWADPSGADSESLIVEGRYKSHDERRNNSNDMGSVGLNTGGSEKAISQSSDPNFKINVNNPETIEGTHVSLQGEITFGIQFREGVKFLGIGEKIDAGIHKVIADAELLWSVKTGFILNINFPENYKEFINQEHIARFGYSNLGFGGEISGVYSGGKVSDLESMGHVGPINLTLSKRMHNLSFEVISGAHTIGLFSFSGSLTINNINTSGMAKGTAADGMALSRTRRDAYLRMIQHNRYSNDGAADKLRMKMRFEAALRKLNKKK